jgi:large subunit ribosomal protein L17
MRHQKTGRKLGRTSSHRLATMRNMVSSLIEHGRIKTTDIKAKELRIVADKMVTLGKKGDLHARRRAMRTLRGKTIAKKLFDEVAPRFADVNGGYTRIIKFGRRPGDNALMSFIEFSIAENVVKEDAGKKDKASEKESK